jgi:lipoate-protein ligase A
MRELSELRAAIERETQPRPTPRQIKESPWCKLPFSDAPMGRQLALSEAMLASLPETGAAILRWYVPKESAVVLGNGQKPGVLNDATLDELGVRAYRRTSGGAAVLVNERLLSLDVALPPSHLLATSDVVDAYRWMGQLWEEALHTLGAAKARALPTEEQRALRPIAKDDPLRLACFGTLSPWEVVVGKRKLVGLCQVRRRAGVLYQVGIHMSFDPKALGVLLDLGNNQRKTLGTRLHNAVVALDQAAGRAIPIEDVATAVEETLRRRFGAQIVPAEWSRAELATADQLQRERFQPLV